MWRARDRLFVGMQAIRPWGHHSLVMEQENHVMTVTVGVDTVLPLDNVQDVLIEGICLAWFMAFRTTSFV